MRILAVFLVCFLSVVSAVAGEIKGNWKFPSDIAVENGKLYVVDGLNNRIAVYNLSGKHITDIKVNSPFGIYAKDGLLYVTSQKGAIYVLNGSGNVEKKIEVKGRPIDVVKMEDKLFVTDGKSNSVNVYSLNGKRLKTIGGKGTAPGYFVGPFMMDRSKELIYVVDTVNARIQEFGKNGNFVRSFGTFGVEQGDLFRPKGVAYCSGNLVVTDAITGAVQLFNIYGGFDGVLAKGLYYPTAVACYGGKVFVLEPLKNEVSTFRIQGDK